MALLALVHVHVEQALVEGDALSLGRGQLLLQPVAHRHLHLLLRVKHVLVLQHEMTGESLGMLDVQ